MTGSHDARERLVAAAEGMLVSSGPRTVSMDAAAAAAGAGKMSAYRHFADKDDLLTAALEHYNPRHIAWLTGADRPGPADPVRRILAVFDRLEAAAGREGFRGCPFVDAALAEPGPDRGAVTVAARHKEELIQELTRLAAQAGPPESGPSDAAELAAAVALVIDGATVQAALAPDPAGRRRIVRRGRRIAEALLTSGGLTPGGQS
jgi:AcrR family transcriptional regulator